DSPAGARLPEYLGGRHPAAVGQLDVLPGLQLPARRAGRDAEPVRDGDVEAAGPRRLDERVPERSDAMVGRERFDRVLAARHRLPRLELDEADRVRQAPDERLEPREE